MFTPEVVGHIDPVGNGRVQTNGEARDRGRHHKSAAHGIGGQRLQDDGRVGLVGGADGDPVHPAVFDFVADLEAEGVAIEVARDASGSSCGRNLA
jgi:hypothetical protein